MLTPSEISERQFKSGLGFDKKDVEQFLDEVSSDYDLLLKENGDLKKKLKDMNDSISYYKSIEKTLQKALILAEKTAQDTRAAALREADAIGTEAKTKAGLILEDARKQLELLEHKAINLMQQYDFFRIKFENLLHSQIELIKSESFSIDTKGFTYKEPNKGAAEENEGIYGEELQKSLAEAVNESDAAINEPEDLDQIHFDFLDEQTEGKSYKTEDGFEFYDISTITDR